MRKHLIFAILLCTVQLLEGQSTYTLPGNEPYHIVDRYDIMYGFEGIHTSIKYFRKSDASHLLFHEDQTSVDRYDLDYLRESNFLFIENEVVDSKYSPASKSYIDSSGVFYRLEDDRNSNVTKDSERNGFLGYFYKRPSSFYYLESDFLKLSVNPIINFRYGNASEDENVIFQNTRGLQLEGLIDNKVYFYTDIIENQGRFNNYIEERISKFEAIPGYGSYKDFQSSISDRLNGYDFPSATAYVGLPVSRHINIELGHGRHFIGNGFNSLLLDDYHHNYYYLKFDTRVWKLHYQNIFAELNPVSARQNPGDVLLPKKYMAAHFLNFKPRKSIEIGLFESVIFSRPNQFELQYLNPVILFRTVEFFLDSPDNVIIGLNGKWNFLDKFSLYGQFVLDEFKLNELKEGSGWWGNKYGIQLGLKAINIAGIDHLDAQVEYNAVRPYTYSHRDSLEGFQNTVANYSHFNQPLAHPLGANFEELILSIRYRPLNKLFLSGKFTSARYGDDPEGHNYGGNVLLMNQTRVSDFGNEIGQGISTKVTSLEFNASYQVFHGMFIDATLLNRMKDSAVDDLDLDTKYIGFGLRANVGNIKLNY